MSEVFLSDRRELTSQTFRYKCRRIERIEEAIVNGFDINTKTTTEWPDSTFILDTYDFFFEKVVGSIPGVRIFFFMVNIR